MHNLGCPKRNSPYADCECAAMEMREHTEQLRRYNETAPTVEMVNQLQAENAELREQLAALTANESDHLRRRKPERNYAEEIEQTYGRSRRHGAAHG